MHTLKREFKDHVRLEDIELPTGDRLNASLKTLVEKGKWKTVGEFRKATDADLLTTDGFGSGSLEKLRAVFGYAVDFTEPVNPPGFDPTLPNFEMLTGAERYMPRGRLSRMLDDDEAIRRNMKAEDVVRILSDMQTKELMRLVQELSEPEDDTQLPDVSVERIFLDGILRAVVRRSYGRGR
jgi:hypothetical protein